MAETRIRNLTDIQQLIITNIKKGEISSAFLIPSIIAKLSNKENDAFTFTHSKSLIFYNYKILTENKFISTLDNESNNRIFKYLNLDINKNFLTSINPTQEKLLLLAEKYLIEHGYLNEVNRIISGYYCINNADFRTASLPHALGLIILSDKFLNLSSDQMVIALSHEIGHQELFLINTIDRLIISSHDKNMIYAPLQQKERPPIGRLHSFFALFRMFEISKKMKIDTNEKKYKLLLEQNYKSLQKDEFTFFANEVINAIWIRVN